MFEHQPLDRLRERDAGVATGKPWSRGYLLGQFPCSRQKTVARDNLAYHSERLRLLRGEFLARQQEIAATVGPEHQRPYDMHAVTGDKRVGKMRGVLEFRILRCDYDVGEHRDLRMDKRRTAATIGTSMSSRFIRRCLASL